MKSKAFRLTDDDVELLLYICEKKECSQTDAVRFALQKGVDAIRSEGGSGSQSEVLSVLAAQMAVKDEQIAALNRALEAAQETAKAAQVLHAQERKALESAEQKSRWQRLRDAWRG